MQTFTEARQQFGEIFPTRESLLTFTLHHHAVHLSQPFDVTFYEREPLLEVTLDRGYAPEFLNVHSFGPQRLRELLNYIAFSNGTSASLAEIWSINAMPEGGFDAATLAAVDLAEAEETIGGQGETIRQIIHATYRTVSIAEEDHFIRRWLAS